VLFEGFIDLAGELMVARGWTAARERNHVGASFVRPVGEGFVATAELEAGRGPIRSLLGRLPKDHPEPPLHASAEVGVSCPEADRLIRAAGGESWFLPAVSVDIGELLVPPREVELTVATIGEVGPAVESLVGMIEEVALPFATARASFDALIEELRRAADDGTPAAWVYIPALLIAFGRVGDAREALVGNPRFTESSWVGRSSRQLTRLLDGEVTLEQLEAAIPPERDWPQHEPITWRGVLDRGRRQRAALDAVRVAGAGATRGQRRDLLLAELERRELREQPSWIETKLDTFEPGYQQPSTIGALSTFGKIAIGVVRAVKEAGQSEPREDPAWLARPAGASYEIVTSRDRVAAHLDDEARTWLDRIHAAAHRVGSVASVDVWFDWDSDSPGEQPRLAVSIGARRVGVLDARATAAFADTMAAATARGELPYISRAMLFQRTGDPHYVLEIPTPQDRHLDQRS
jgi:hypothetical protein